MAKKKSKKPPKAPQRTEPVPTRTVAVPRHLGEGEVRLYDAHKAGLPDLVDTPSEKLLAEFNWVLVHFPSRRCSVVKEGRLEAFRIMKEVERGKDVLKLLPEKVKASRVRAHAREGAGAKAAEPEKENGEDGEEIVIQRPTLRIEVDPSLSFEKALEAAFSPQFLINEICDVLRAAKPVQDRNGNIVAYQEDFMTRTTALFKLVEQAKGRAGEKPPPAPDKKKVTFEELNAMVKTSPAARTFLRRLLDDAETEAAEAATAPVEGAAATPADGK